MVTMKDRPKTMDEALSRCDQEFQTEFSQSRQDLGDGFDRRYRALMKLEIKTRDSPARELLGRLFEKLGCELPEDPLYHTTKRRCFERAMYHFARANNTSRVEFVLKTRIQGYDANKVIEGIRASYQG